MNCFDSGLQIYHGANCIGDNGKTPAIPYIEDNLDPGFGVCIICNVHLANNVTIGANAVMIKSCNKKVLYWQVSLQRN